MNNTKYNNKKNIKIKNTTKKTIKIKNKTLSKKLNKTKRTFNKNDYNSGDGFLTSIWGPQFWFILHIVSFNYPVNPSEKDKKNYMNFIINLQNILPCKYCRENFKNNLKQLPITNEVMKNRDTFSRYIFRMHELVNKMLNKKSGLSYCDVRERFEHFRARCTEEKPKLFKFNKKKLNKTLKSIKKPSEKGCTEPLYGTKSKCIIKIVPQSYEGNSLQINEKCIKKKEI